MHTPRRLRLRENNRWLRYEVQQSNNQSTSMKWSCNNPSSNANICSWTLIVILKQSADPVIIFPWLALKKRDNHLWLTLCWTCTVSPERVLHYQGSWCFQWSRLGPACVVLYWPCGQKDTCGRIRLKNGRKRSNLTPLSCCNCKWCMLWGRPFRVQRQQDVSMRKTFWHHSNFKPWSDCCLALLSWILIVFRLEACFFGQTEVFWFIVSEKNRDATAHRSHSLVHIMV